MTITGHLIRLVPLGLLAWGVALGDVEKPRDAGKAEPIDGKPEKNDARKGPGKRLNLEENEHEAIHRKLAEEGETNLKEIARLMEKIRNNLSEKQTGAATQAEQKETVKKLQELIDKLGKG
jgi:hypothetical protein